MNTNGTRCLCKLCHTGKPNRNSTIRDVRTWPYSKSRTFVPMGLIASMTLLALLTTGCHMVGADVLDSNDTPISELGKNQLTQLKLLLKLKKERYCGNHLPNIVHLVCEGVYYDGISKRSLPDQPSSNDASENSYSDDSDNSEDVLYSKGAAIHPSTQNGGIYQECCVKSCTLLQLRAYCKKKLSADRG